MPWALAAIAFIMSIAWLPIPSAVSSPRWWVIGVGSSLLLCFTKIRMTTEHVLGALILAWCALTSLWSYSPVDTYGSMLQPVVLAAVFCVAAEVKTLRPFYIALAAGATINAGIAIAQMRGVSLFDYANQSAGIPTGVFGNKNFLANFAVLAALGCFALPDRWWSWLLSIGSAIAVALPESRGAALALGVGLLVKFWRPQFAWALLGIIPLAVGAIYYDLYFSTHRMTTSVSPRLEMWDWAISNFTWFGWGHGTFGTVFPFEHASNDFLEIVFELGVGSTLAFCFFALLLTRSPRSTETSILAAALVEACVAFPLHQAATLFVVAVVAGRIAGEHRRALLDQPVGGDIGSERLSLPWPLCSTEIHATELRR